MPEYLFQGISEKLAKLAGLPPEEREVVAYGLEYLVTLVAGLALMLFIGFALRRLPEALFVLCCWVLMRLVAGGAHCTALWRCTVANGAGMLAALLVTAGAGIVLPRPAWVGTAFLWALLAVGFWAPNNSERPVHDPRRRKVLRRRALILVAFTGATLLALSVKGPGAWPTFAAAGATGLFFGGLMISPAGFKMIALLDRQLSRLACYFVKGGETK